MDNLRDKFKKLELNPFKKGSSSRAFAGAGHRLGSAEAKPVSTSLRLTKQQSMFLAFKGGSDHPHSPDRSAFLRSHLLQAAAGAPSSSRPRPPPASPPPQARPLPPARPPSPASNAARPSSPASSENTPVPAAPSSIPPQQADTEAPLIQLDDFAADIDADQLEAIGQAVEQMRRDPLGDGAVNVLGRLLRNVVSNPADSKFRRLRLSNPKIQVHVRLAWCGGLGQVLAAARKALYVLSGSNQQNICSPPPSWYGLHRPSPRHPTRLLLPMQAAVVNVGGGVELLLACGFEIIFEEPAAPALAPASSSSHPAPPETPQQGQQETEGYAVLHEEADLAPLSAALQLLQPQVTAPPPAPPPAPPAAVAAAQAAPVEAKKLPRPEPVYQDARERNTQVGGCWCGRWVLVWEVGAGTCGGGRGVRNSNHQPLA
jgi:hypothetical protein